MCSKPLSDRRLLESVSALPTRTNMLFAIESLVSKFSDTEILVYTIKSGCMQLCLHQHSALLALNPSFH